MKINTYLNYGGNCKEAFEFYEKHLGGKILMAMTFAETPGGNPGPPELANGILFARMAIGETEIMGNDVAPERFQPMRSAYLCLSVASPEEAERIQALLAEDGEIFMPMAETFFAFRFSMLRDRFGTSWMVICERPMGGS
jgi:PhnB protein